MRVDPGALARVRRTAFGPVAARAASPPRLVSPPSAGESDRDKKTRVEQPSFDSTCSSILPSTPAGAGAAALADAAGAGAAGAGAASTYTSMPSSSLTPTAAAAVAALAWPVARRVAPGTGALGPIENAPC